MPDGNQLSKDHRVGKSIPRPDAKVKVTGALHYVDDLPFEGLYGATVRTKTARGRMTGLRFKDGVDVGVDWREFAVVTANDIPRTSKLDGIDPNQVMLIDRDQPFLVRDEFRHVGEPVCLLAHPDPEVLRRAVDLVEIKTESLPAVLDYRQPPTDAQVQRGEPGPDANLFKRIVVSKGAADEGDDAFSKVFEDAAHIVSGTYETQAQEQCYIEPNGIIARVEVSEADAQGALWPANPWKLIIEGSMQCPYYVHKAITHLFQLPDDGVQIIQAATGGGFGGKEDYPSIISGHAGLLALKTRQPVKLIYDRVEDMAFTTKRHPSRTHLRAALDADGKLLGIDMDVTLDGGAYLTLSPVVLSRGAIHAVGPYRVPHVRVHNRAVLSNTPPHGAFRGFGAPQTVFAFERHLDRCAREVGIDPVELRRRNLIIRGDALAISQRIDEPIELHKWMDEALTAGKYEERRAAHAAFNEAAETSGSPLRRGVGVATFMHGAGFTGSGEDYLASEVMIRAAVGADGLGGVEVCTANTEIGQGAITIFTQIAADALGLPLSAVQIAKPDTDQVPNSGPTVASRTSMVVGHLVARASDDLVRKLESQGTLSDGDLHPNPDDDRASALSDARGRKFEPTALRGALATAAAQDGGALEGWATYQRPPGGKWNDVTYKGIAYGTYAWATYLADVEVDLTTFETRITDFVASQEIGRVLNPLLAEGQIQGGVVQAMGWALLEDTVYKDGRITNPNMTNYVVPTFADVPDVQVLFQESPYAYGPWGAKGIGELPMDGPAPAILNAISAAVGVEIDALPASPERVMRAVLAAQSSEVSS
ncbi:MAG: xanthine dehydrogenase family protein [Myxococcales bacterium]|nr:xanthine dehydrogenase family protein [Myxococcales bacterium]